MSEVKVVGRGVDTLVLNAFYADKNALPVKQELAEELQAELSILQDEAREQEVPVVTRWAFRGFALWMQPKGSRGPWRWILRCPLLSIAISRGRFNGIIAQVRLSSELLWSCDTVASALVSVEDFLCVFLDAYPWLQVSAVDLCADVIGWDVACCNWQEGFVSRAVGENGRPVDISALVDGPDVVRRRWKEIATLDFGRHTSPISCCIYHKSAEIRQKSPTKAWFHDLWKRNGWDELADVWRVEFRLTREFLHSIGLEDMHDLPERLPAIWSYCAGQVGGAADSLPDGWLRYVIPTEDTNRSRWPVHPAWSVVQGAFASEDEGLGPVVRKRIREKNIRRGLAAVIGYLSTLSAWVGGEMLRSDADISLILHWLYEVSDAYLEEKARKAKKEIDFPALVAEKFKLYRSNEERAS